MKYFIILLFILLISCGLRRELYLGIHDEIPHYIEKSSIIKIDTLNYEMKLIYYKEK